MLYKISVCYETVSVKFCPRTKFEAIIVNMLVFLRNFLTINFSLTEFFFAYCLFLQKTDCERLDIEAAVFKCLRCQTVILEMAGLFFGSFFSLFEPWMLVFILRFILWSDIVCGWFAMRNVFFANLFIAVYANWNTWVQSFFAGFLKFLVFFLLFLDDKLFWD